MKNRNFVEHLKPKIKIHFKYSSLKHLTKIQNPTHTLALGIAVEIIRLSFYLSDIATESPTPTKLLRHETIFVGGTPKSHQKIYLNQYIKLAVGFSLDCFTS